MIANLFQQHKMMLLPFLLLWVLLLNKQQQAFGQIYRIKSLATPANCFGGQACQNQPQVGVYNSGGVLAVNFAGFVYVNMGISPSGVEPLWLGDCDYTDDCGLRVYGSIVSVPFVNGVATFQV